MAGNSPTDGDSPLETFWRSTIMLGTLVVGGMGLYRYGPPPDQAAAMLDGAASRVQELIDQASGEPPVPAPAPLPAQPSRPPVLTQAPVSPQAIALAFAEPPPSTDINRLKDELARLGAADFSLQPWGFDQAMHRFCCSAPLAAVGSEGPGFRRHFEAVAPDANQAVASVLAEVRQWRRSTASYQ